MDHPGQDADRDADGASESALRIEPAFAWKSYGRFVEVCPVETGWLVLWGRYEQQGAVRLLAGQRVYLDLAGVRDRLADAVLELTKRGELVAEAILLFDRHRFPAHDVHPLPDPL